MLYYFGMNFTYSYFTNKGRACDCSKIFSPTGSFDIKITSFESFLRVLDTTAKKTLKNRFNYLFQSLDLKSIGN